MVDNIINNNVTDYEEREETTNLRIMINWNILKLKNGIEYHFQRLFILQWNYLKITNYELVSDSW